MTTPTHFMQQALSLARKGLGTVSPNPMVGCVLVKNGYIIGEGYHQRAGSAHAEINALAESQTDTHGATLYTNLEPCCHHGKTPPCTDALFRAGIKHAYVACLDPNPLVAGNGVAALRAAGITVEVGLEETAAKQLNEIFFHYITHQRPFVIAKWAMSLDGKTVTHAGDDRTISNTTSHQHTHQTRAMVDAILVGANTIIRDNPLLTARLDNDSSKQPLRVVLTTHGNLPLDANIFDSAVPGKTIVFTTEAANPAWREALQQKNIEVILTEKNVSGQIKLSSVLDELGKREITSLLVEGGMTLLESFFQEQLVNKINVYLAPTIIGSLEKKHSLKDIALMNMNGDHYFTANLTGDV